MQLNYFDVNHSLFSSETFGKYCAQKLETAYPKLMTIPNGESFAGKCLQLNPKKRINASDAMRDSFFSALPDRVHQLTPGKLSCIIMMNGVTD